MIKNNSGGKGGGGQGLRLKTGENWIWEENINAFQRVRSHPSKWRHDTQRNDIQDYDT